MSPVTTAWQGARNLVLQPNARLTLGGSYALAKLASLSYRRGRYMGHAFEIEVTCLLAPFPRVATLFLPALSITVIRDITVLFLCATRRIRMLSSHAIANSSELRWPTATSDGSSSNNMGQDQSSQKPSEMSTSKCFHKIGSTDADLPLLRDRNVWIEESLAAQSQDEKVPPHAASDTSDEILEEDKYDDELFYCEACCISDSWTGGFNTRSTIKDGRKVCSLLCLHKEMLTEGIRLDSWMHNMMERISLLLSGCCTAMETPRTSRLVS